MKNIKKKTVNFPYLERPVEIYERECGHRIVFAYKKGSLINISSWVKTGSINENDENNGISHFLEHLMFKGTSKHKAGEFDRILEGRGAIVNAATWKDYTFYYVTLPKGADERNFKDTLELHADMMLDPVIPDNEIGAPFDLNEKVKEKRERHVVIEEIRMRKDQPWTKVYNQANANMYVSHPYKRDVIGNENIISSITREEVLEYYKTHYTPNNIITIITGDLNFEEALPLAAEKFDFKGRKNRENELFEQDKPAVKTKIVESRAQITTGFMTAGWLAPAASDIKSNTALEIAALVLGQGQSSRLYQELIEKAENPLFNALTADYYQFRGGGNFLLQANFKPDKKDAAFEQIKIQLEKFLKDGISEKELNKAKKKLKANFAENAETVSDISETIGFYMTVCSGLECVEEYVQTLENITAEDINSVLREHLDVNKAVVSFLMPEQPAF